MTTDLVEAMSLWLNSKLEDIHTGIPGKIEKYDEETQTADVLPLLSKITIKNVEVALPVIPGVPVMFPAGQAFSLSWEVQKGDGVWLVFSEAALGAWVNSEGDKQVTPEGKHRFSETDAIAIPGLSPKVVVPKVKFYIDKNGNVEITDITTFKINSGSSPFVKGDALDTFFNTLLNNSWMSLPAGTQVQNAAILTALQVAATTAKASLATLQSTKVSAE